MLKSKVPEKLNICMIAHRFPIVGRAAGRGFLWPIAKELAQKGHSVTVITWKSSLRKKEVIKDGVQAYFLGEQNFTKIENFPTLVYEKFKQLHKQEKFHIVHSLDSSGHLVGRRKKELQVVMTYDVAATEMAQLFSILSMSQETLLNQVHAGLAIAYSFITTFFKKDRKLLKSADGVFVTSALQQIILERHYLYPELKTFTIPYGLEVGDLSPRERSEEFREKLGLPESGHVIMTITDMKELEEMKLLLRTFEQVAIKKPNARLIIVGSGPLLKEIEFEMLNLALGNKVHFVGDVSPTDLPDYIGLSDVYVDLSARSSGFEASMIEAMAQKKVIIGSEVSPISTIVEDGINGFLIRPADITTLTSLLVQIFSQQLATEEIGNCAREKVLNIFDTKKMVDLTIEAYKKTLKSSGRYKAPFHIFSWRSNSTHKLG